MNKQKYICPVCGYDELGAPPYDEKGEPSFDTCPCCGFEYGLDDYEIGFEDYREKWALNGFKWADESKKPKDWDVTVQLNNLHKNIFKKGIKHGPFMEFQYCEKFLPIKKIFKFKNIRYWADDSLYVEVGDYNEGIFYKSYFDILNCANLPNGEIGFDCFGMNYYTLEQTKQIYEKVKENKKLPDRDALLEWLKPAIEKYNGFYILGA